VDVSRVDSIGVRLAELVATFALGQDNAFGQPMGSQLRSCLLATMLAESMQLSGTDRETVYWAAQLRYVGCTGHAHEVSAVFGDEIEVRARSLVNDLTNPREVMREIVTNAGRGHTAARRVRDVLAMLAGGRKYMEMNFRTGCEVGDVLLERLGMPDGVRDSLRYTFERWNGNGFPNGAKGASIPLPMRIVHLSQDVEALSRIQGPDSALDTARKRSGRTYDPDIVDALLSLGHDIFHQLDKVDPWDEALSGEPAPHHMLRGSGLDEALLVAADFIDLKSPYTAGHSRGVANLAAAAVEHLGMDRADVRAARRAAWVHDFGRTAIPNSIWDKPTPLTRSEVDRVELHPLLTEQMLRRSPGLATLNPIASCHHEKLDGSGYSKGLSGSSLSPAARVVATADCYHAMTEDRAHRPALSPTHAAAELRQMVAQGKLDAEPAEAVLHVAGHDSRTVKRRTYPAGLTEREVQVLRLAAQGFTAKQIAERLVISAKTADHHIQHIYAKIGVSTRGAAALFAIEHDLVRPRSS
jgi:HD-GYP domain-containing protein (c-di-GMP phosphodiesterase class II)